MSYQEQECGPWGITLSQELGRMSRLNTSYSEFAWQSAKQEGCHYPCPTRKLPSWPPCGNFIYPTLQKEKQVVLGAHQYDPDLQSCPEAAPWQEDAPEKTSLTCAMTRAQRFLNEQPGGYDPQNQFDYSNLEYDTDMAAQVARSIIGGTIPMNTNVSSSEEQYFGDSQTNSSGEEVLSEDEYNLRNLFPCIGNTFSGIAYDMAHYDQLPTDKKFEYIIMRDTRWKYVVTTGLLFLFVILLIAAIVTTSMGGYKKSVPIGGKIIDLSKLGVDNLENMQIIIRPKNR